jgi:AmmeMemoRadiSam system protein B
MLRRAAWADRFYPANPAALNQELDRCLGDPPGDKMSHPLGCICPHAGYIYSGPIAGAVYSRLDLPDRFIILCPNHTGMGDPLAIMPEGEWETPLGRARIDARLAARVKKGCPLLTDDVRAHQEEHALEVQLPFLQRLRPGLEFVPIAVGAGSFPPLETLGRAIAEAVRGYDRRVLVVSSSDMNHYEDDRRTRLKDRRAIDQVLALDPQALYNTVRREKISMCGYGPTVAMLTAALELGAKHAELVRYGTSAEVSGDYDRVVGYAGMVVW